MGQSSRRPSNVLAARMSQSSQKKSEDFLKIKDMAIKRGMRTLRQSALRKLAEGITTFEEVIRVTGI